MIDDAKAAANKQARAEKKAAHLRALMDRQRAELQALPQGDAPALAREVHARIELVLEGDRKRASIDAAIQCGKGCSHCCSNPVEIWPQEAALLIEAARAAGSELDIARLQRQSRYTIETWQQQPAED